MLRVASVGLFVTFLAGVLACGGAAPTTQRKGTEPEQPSEDEKILLTEKWRAEMEEKALELANKGDEMEARLIEREATYERRTKAGLLDGSTRDEIEKLKKDIPKLWRELALLENRIAAGPPASLFIRKQDAKDTSTTSSPTKALSGQIGSQETAQSGTDHGYVRGSHKVHVSGYVTKTGTVVAPYTRSSPKRR
jgi:hypothetical protein